MFSITVDADRRFISARIWGFMTLEEVADFFRQEQEAVAAMGCGTGGFVLLVDTVDAFIQSQEVVAAFIEMVATMRYKARRIAVLRGSTLTRMQTERILMIRATSALFTSVEAAEAWLFADGADKAAAA